MSVLANVIYSQCCNCIGLSLKSRIAYCGIPGSQLLISVMLISKWNFKKVSTVKFPLLQGCFSCPIINCQPPPGCLNSPGWKLKPRATGLWTSSSYNVRNQRWKASYEGEKSLWERSGGDNWAENTINFKAQSLYKFLYSPVILLNTELLKYKVN